MPSFFACSRSLSAPVRRTSIIVLMPILAKAPSPSRLGWPPRYRCGVTSAKFPTPTTVRRRAAVCEVLAFAESACCVIPPAHRIVSRAIKENVRRRLPIRKGYTVRPTPVEQTRKSLAHRHAHRRDSLSGCEPHHELVLAATTDDRVSIAILSDPNNPLGVHKNFQTVHILKQYKLHAASLWVIAGTYHVLTGDN